MDIIMQALHGVNDPELGVSIVELGLVYDVKLDGKKAHIKMTFTNPMCPLGGFILSKVEEAVREKGYEPKVDLVFDPPWNPDRMSPELKKRFKF